MYVSVSLNNGIKLVIHIIVKLTVIRLWRILQVMLTLIVAPELRPSNISCRLKTSDPNIIRCCCWLSIVHIVQHGMTAAVATVWLSHLDTNWPQHTIAAAVEHMYSDVACFFLFYAIRFNRRSVREFDYESQTKPQSNNQTKKKP